MTQKDLLYFEDAIEHEKAMVEICNNFLLKLKNNELKSFVREQINSHEKIRDELLYFLKEKANE